jgi:S-(hydroxymethyl)glutathione dehydrogenase/alcohol dehydrogenase
VTVTVGEGKGAYVQQALRLTARAGQVVVGPRTRIPRLPDLYRVGRPKLDELVTPTYRLEDVDRAYEDMRAGRNPRGVDVYADADTVPPDGEAAASPSGGAVGQPAGRQPRRGPRRVA